MDDDRLLTKAARHKYDERSEGDILSDAPKTESWDELKAAGIRVFAVGDVVVVEFLIVDILI